MFSSGQETAPHTEKIKFHSYINKYYGGGNWLYSMEVFNPHTFKMATCLSPVEKNL